MTRDRDECKEASNQPESNVFKDSGYIDILYSKERRPQTTYPSQLARHLRTTYYRGTGSLLDIGCGRGDMLKALAEAGFTVAGVDLSPSSAEACKPHPVAVANLETDALPYPDASFDYVFSKSVIEHLRTPMHVLKEALRVLRPGGLAVIMTPSWLHHGWGPFYLDHTHVTPFTLPSLRDVMSLTGFQGVAVEHFRQLPFLWKSPWMTPLVSLLASLPLRYSPMYEVTLPRKVNTLFRFSKEVMLLAMGRKPLQTT